LAKSFQLTVIAKSNGPLTKRISLSADGSLKSDGSACVMSRGRAWRIELNSPQQLAELISGLGSHQAITLGALRDDLPDEVQVVARHRLNGAAGVIARTQDFLGFRPGAPALSLADYDSKGMPPAIRARIEDLGGFWPVLTSVLPALKNVARVTRRSTSAGLSRSDTGEAIPGSDGTHAYVLLKDGSDGERFLKVLHDRCWLAGLGWMMVGTAGQLLERSIVDRVVGSPERLLFEGAPVLDPPLAQDQESRRPVAVEGETLDTVAGCPPLTAVEQSKLRQRRTEEALRLAPEAARARADYIQTRIQDFVKRGMAPAAARKLIERQCDGILWPALELPFDDVEFAGSTVADVLADPARFEGATLADPLEGVGYGRCTARIMRRSDGTPWIHSFAHGRTVYDLKFDFDAAKAALTNEPEASVADVFVRLVLLGDFDPVETERLLKIAATRARVTPTAIKAKLRAAQAATSGTFANIRQKENRFAVQEQCLVYLKRTDIGVLPVKLANFDACIVEDQVFDDGAAELRRYLIEGELEDGTPLPPIIVPAKEFVGPAWVGPRWGARAIVDSGVGARMLCEAIQTMSPGAAVRRVYGHIGWRKIGDKWIYLHAGGAIGEAGGVPNINVELTDALAGYQLPVPQDLPKAVSASLELLKLNVMAAAATWRAPLGEFCPINFSPFTSGRTGSFKSALWGVAQAHWGSRWGDGIHFPANWSGTTNSLEKLAFLAKDALFVIDDFAPSGSPHAINALHEKAADIFRAQGNLGGRSRLRSDTGLRPTYYPRGMIASSGEDVPRGHSLRARMVIDQIGPDDIDPNNLHVLQNAATDSRLAEAMAGYVQWTAHRANTSDLAGDLHKTQNRLRRNFAGGHRRTPDAAASLMLGVKEFLDFAVEIGAIGDLEAEALFTAAEHALRCGATAQAVEQAQEDPVEMFVSGIASALASGRAHLTSRDGTEPANAPSLFGWRKVPKNGAEDCWLAQGDRIGWLASDRILILPDESIAVIERVLREQGRSIAISRSALGKRLREKGWLIEVSNNTFTKVVSIGGEGSVRVFVFAKSQLFPPAE
jgi:hypothetical protein